MQENIAPTEPKFGFSILETVERSGLSRSFIYKQIAGGHLIARKAGARTIILPKDLESYLANLPRAAGAEGEVEAPDESSEEEPEEQEPEEQEPEEPP